MTTQTKIVFYDIPSLLPGGQAISPFTNTARYVLEYKRLAFTTEYVELVNVTSECQRLGIPPTGTKVDTKSGTQVPTYTLPAIIDSTGGKPVIVSDSVRILEYLEKTYPDPERPLFPGLATAPGGAAGGAADFAPALHLLGDRFIFNNVIPIARPLIAEGLYAIITPSSKAYWKANWFGEDGILEFPQKGTESYNGQVRKMVEAFEGLADVLLKNGAAAERGVTSWTMGSKPTFLDFRLRAVCNVLEKTSPELWNQVKTLRGGVFEKHISSWSGVQS
jgi:glutathione S-transferase